MKGISCMRVGRAIDAMETFKKILEEDADNAEVNANYKFWRKHRKTHDRYLPNSIYSYFTCNHLSFLIVHRAALSASKRVQLDYGDQLFKDGNPEGVKTK